MPPTPQGPSPLPQIAASTGNAVSAALAAIKSLAGLEKSIVALVPSLTQLQTVVATTTDLVTKGLTVGIKAASALIIPMTEAVKGLTAAGVSLIRLIPGFAQVQSAAVAFASVLVSGLSVAFGAASRAAVAFGSIVGPVLAKFGSGIMEVVDAVGIGLQAIGAAGMSVLSLIPGFATLQGVVIVLSSKIVALGAAAIGLVPGLTAAKAALVGVAAFLSGGLIAALGSVSGQVTTWAAGLVGSVKSFLGTNQVAYAVISAVDKAGAAFGETGKAAMSAGNAVYQFAKASVDIAGAMAQAAANAAKMGANLLRLPFNVLDTAISSIQMNVARFVQLAQPGVMMQFERSVDDLYATIGHILVPVLQVATQFMRSMGGALFGLTSDGQKAIQMLAAGAAGMLAFAAAATAVATVMSGGLLPVISAVVGGLSAMLVVSGEFKGIFDTMAQVVGGGINAIGGAVSALMPIAQPFLDLLGDVGNLLAWTITEYANAFTSMGPELAAISAAFGEVKNAVMQVVKAVQGAQTAIFITAIKLVAEGLAFAAPYVAAFAKIIGNFVADVIKWTAELFGINMPGIVAQKGELKDNTGAAARSVSTGDPNDALRKAREAAFQLGTGPKPEEKTAENTTEIKNAMVETQKKIDQIVTSVQEFPNQVKTYITEGADKLVGGLSDALKALVKFSVDPVGVTGGDNVIRDAITNQLKRLNPFS